VAEIGNKTNSWKTAIMAAIALSNANNLAAIALIDNKIIVVPTSTYAPLASDLNNLTIVCTYAGTSTINLPVGDASIDGKPFRVHASTANAVKINPDDSQRINLDSEDLAPGVKITTDGTIGTLTMSWDHTSSRWRVLYSNMILSDDGA
jgi:hypothetical protein